jgi:hypothetical protein
MRGIDRLIMLNFMGILLSSCATQSPSSPSTATSSSPAHSSAVIQQDLRPQMIYTPGGCQTTGQPFTPLSNDAGTIVIGTNVQSRPLSYNGQPYECEWIFTFYDGVMTIAANALTSQTHGNLTFQWKGNPQSNRNCLQHITVAEAASNSPAGTITIPTGSWDTLQSTTGVEINRTKHSMQVDLTSIIQTAKMLGQSSITMRLGAAEQDLGTQSQCLATYTNFVLNMA